MSRRWNVRADPVPPGYTIIETLNAEIVVIEEDHVLAQQQKISELDTSSIEDKRSRDFRPFKLEYTGFEDLSHRLRGTIITIKGNPYYVSEVRPGLELWVRNRPGDISTLSKISYKSPDVDCRPIPARYIQHAGSAYFLYRNPIRQQQQGMHQNNTALRNVFHGWTDRVGDLVELIPALENTQTEQYTPALGEFMLKGYCGACVLSPKVAVRVRDKQLEVGFKGRRLGTLAGRTVLVDSFDLSRPWIKSTLDEVNLGIGSK